MNSEFLSVPPLFVTIGLIILTIVANVTLGFGILILRWKAHRFSICLHVISLICSLYDFILCYWITQLNGYPGWITFGIFFGFILPFGGSIIAMKVTCHYWTKDLDSEQEEIELQTI